MRILSTLLAVGLAMGAVPASAASGTPGSAGIGDRLYPRSGNGGYDVDHYDLRLRYPAKDPAQTVIGTVTMTALAAQDLSRFNLDFAGTSVRRVVVDGRPAAFRRDRGELVVTPRRVVVAGRRFSVVTDFTTTPVAPETWTSAGLVRTPDGTVVAGAARRVFPCNDHPRDKATYTFVLTAPRGWTATANGTRASVVRRGDTVTTTYRESRPTASGSVQIAVGDFVVRRREPWSLVAVRDVVPRRLAGELLPKAAAERDQLYWMVERLGPYPFDSYGSLVVDAGEDFHLGTQTLSLFDTERFAAPDGHIRPVMANALAQQWFGASVSPHSWSDLWLTEGHANFYEIEYAADTGILDDWTGADSLADYYRPLYRSSDEWRAEYGPPARPASAADLTDLYNPSVYNGGALALYALRDKIGPLWFRDIEVAWVSVYANGVGSTENFIALATHVTGQNLRPFLTAWLYGARTPPMPGHPDWTVEPAGTGNSAGQHPGQRSARS